MTDCRPAAGAGRPGLAAPRQHTGLPGGVRNGAAGLHVLRLQRRAARLLPQARRRARHVRVADHHLRGAGARARPCAAPAPLPGQRLAVRACVPERSGCGHTPKILSGPPPARSRRTCGPASPHPSRELVSCAGASLMLAALSSVCMHVRMQEVACMCMQARSRSCSLPGLRRTQLSASERAVVLDGAHMHASSCPLPRLDEMRTRVRFATDINSKADVGVSWAGRRRTLLCSTFLAAAGQPSSAPSPASRAPSWGDEQHG